MDDPYERIAADPLLRQAIEAARSWGVSPSRFLGADVVTRHEYDAVGRLAASITASEWTADDRELVFAFLAWEAALCPGCRHPLAETMAAENEERYRGKLEGRCHRCTRLEIEQEKHAKKDHAGALLLSVTLADPEPEASDVAS
jgi:hypothetical protein